MNDVMKDYVKIDSILTRLAGRYPSNDAVWKGTASERLKVISDLILEELDNARK